MRRFLILLGCLLAGSALADNLNFARLDNTDGLSNNQVECIFKDSRGFIWFGTNFGLNRFDGYRMETFLPLKNDTNSLLYNAVPDIMEDKDGNLWLGGNPNYCVLDVTTETFHRDISPIMADLGFDFVPTLIDIDQAGNFKSGNH
jgi:ligand-binding sensor domain-containing protein